MIENTKCECGHNNPIGTILCEYCGKPLDEGQQEKKSIEKEMRYDGVARRSQKKEQNFLDRVWSFFSSVKVAIILIVITLLASGIGTIFEQERLTGSSDPESYYIEKYGVWGEWYYKLGFSDMYNSWWFATLLAMIGVSLVICSLDRVVPLYRALKNQTVPKSTHFILRQRISHQETLKAEDKEEKWKKLIGALKKKRYEVRQEGNSILAEKGRISRWGPYINHIGLIIFLVGVLLRFIVPGWYLEQALYIREGETLRLPDTPYYLKNEKFTVEMYEGEFSNVPKNYQTDAILYEKDKNGQLVPVHRHAIRVNHPLEYNELFLVQADYQMETTGLKLKVIEKQTKKNLGTFSVDFQKISANQVYKVGDLEIRALEYYPDFVLQNGRPATQSQEPNLPAFVFEVKAKGANEGEKSWVISGQDTSSLTPQNKYEIDLEGIETALSSGLLIRVDQSLPIIFAGGFICLIGLVMGFYWHHRRIWIKYEDGKIYLGSHTNKSWYSLRREIDQIAEQSGLRLKLTQE